MDEAPCYLEIGFETTIDFTGRKNIEILTYGREDYKLSIILAVSWNGNKLPPFLIIKSESDKTQEKEFRGLYYNSNNNIYMFKKMDGAMPIFLQNRYKIYS